MSVRIEDRSIVRHPRPQSSLPRLTVGSSRWTRIAGAAAVLATLAAIAASSEVGASTIRSCSQLKLRQAVAAGGHVSFAVDCQITLTRTLEIPSGLTVNIDANGHNVVLDGGGAVRHFKVSGGTLAVTGLRLQNGSVTGVSRPQAGSGASGSDGPAGPTGSGGTTGGCISGDDDGESGGPGGPGTPGDPGRNAAAGAVASGGSIFIGSGNVTLNAVTLSNNAVRGGTAVSAGRAGPEAPAGTAAGAGVAPRACRSRSGPPAPAAAAAPARPVVPAALAARGAEAAPAAPRTAARSTTRGR